MEEVTMNLVIAIVVAVLVSACAKPEHAPWIQQMWEDTARKGGE